jgi:uncharacterized protein (TIGR02246 family)
MTETAETRVRVAFHDNGRTRSCTRDRNRRQAEYEAHGRWFATTNWLRTEGTDHLRPPSRRPAFGKRRLLPLAQSPNPGGSRDTGAALTQEQRMSTTTNTAITTTTTAITAADKDAIRDLVALAQESQSEPEALLNLHTAEAAIVNLAGRRVVGREPFANAMAAALSSPLRDVLTTVEIDDIRLATPDVAIVSCTKTVHDGRAGVDNPDRLDMVGALTYVTVRGDDGWRIALAQTTPIITAPTMTTELQAARNPRPYEHHERLPKPRR